MNMLSVRLQRDLLFSNCNILQSLLKNVEKFDNDLTSHRGQDKLIIETKKEKEFQGVRYNNNNRNFLRTPRDEGMNVNKEPRNRIESRNQEGKREGK